jgi:phospholipid/cholesterol/gamma-HCH transport system substrate-binding protein
MKRFRNFFGKSFRDRNPYAIGIISVLAIAAATAFAFMVGVLHLLEHTYPVRAEFADAAGIRGGDDVKVAGVRAGRVVKVKADRRQGRVVVDLVVNKGVHLGPDTKAEVALETLLGTKYVRLSGAVHEPFLEKQPEARRIIPVERTKTPFDVFELTTVGTRAIQKTDTAKLNQFVTQLADITQGNQVDIHDLLTGVDQVSRALNERDTQLRDLFDKLDRLTALLAEKDQTLVGLIDQSQVVLDLVARRRDDIVRGIGGATEVANQLNGIIAGHKTQLDFILSTLHPTIDILDKRAATVDKALSFIGPGALGLSKATAHGPWQDIYVRAIGPDVLAVLNTALSQGKVPVPAGSGTK